MSGGGMGGGWGGGAPRGGGMGQLKYGGGTPGVLGGFNPAGLAGGGNAINSATGNAGAAAAFQGVTKPEEQQAQYAQNQATGYHQQQQSALGIAAPTVANASQAQLNQSRAQLGHLANAYGQVASGQGPMGTVAENQYQQALGQSMASNLALAHSAGGGALGGAGAMRAAQQQNAQAGAGAAGQSGMIQAQQQQAGLAGQAGAYGQLSNINLSQYGTAQQVANYRAQLAQQQTGQNEGFYANLGNLQSNQQGIANQSTQSLGGLGVQAGLGEAGVAVGAQNAATSQVGTMANVGGAVAGTVSGLVGSDTNMKSAVQPEGDASVSVTGGSGESTRMSTAPSSGALAAHDAAGLAQGAIKGVGIGGTIGSILPGIGNAIGAGIGAIVGGGAGLASAAASGLPNQTTGVAGPSGSSTVNAPGYGPGAILSDERLKMSKVGEGPGAHMSVADAFLRHIDPYSYEYKDPNQAPGGLASQGRFLGVMAQDLEKTPQIGHQLVVDTPEGKKVNGLAALSATMAGLGRLSERVNELEKGRRMSK